MEVIFYVCFDSGKPQYLNAHNEIFKKKHNAVYLDFLLNLWLWSGRYVVS